MKKNTYRTRNQLKEEISRLRDQLRQKAERSAVINAANLPPCKSLACINCKHIVIHKTTGGWSYLLGCGKDIECPDFKQRVYNLTEADREALERQICGQ